MVIFSQIGIGIIAGALIAALGSFVKQPAILGYIIAGILLGPSVFGVIVDPELINTVSHIGIMLLLFLIGLEMGVDKIKDMGLVSLVAGAGQVFFTGVVGYGIAMLLGFTPIVSLYIAVALTFSSTVIAIKLMSEKNDLNTVHGEISIGILIVQDVLAIVALLLLTGFSAGSFAFDSSLLLVLLLKGVLLLAGALFLTKTVVARFFRAIADSAELLILCAVAWCFFVALVGKKIGFSMEIGAFIAGISLANIPYAAEISAKAKVIRDFFVTIFFIALGAGMIFESIDQLIGPFLILSGFVLIGNPLIIMILMRCLKYDVKTGLFTGLNMANISEFSLIVIALGGSLGHIDQSAIALVTMICVTTMTVSSYMITYANTIYEWLKPVLKKFDVRKTLAHNLHHKDDHIVVIGYGDTGREIVEQMRGQGSHVIVIEQNNRLLKELQHEKIPVVFGSVDDDHVLHHAHLDRAELVIITIPFEEDALHVLKYLAQFDDEGRPRVMVVTQAGKQGLKFFNAGADYVVVKPHVGARMVIDAANKILENDTVVMTPPAQVLLPDTDNDLDYARFVDHLSAMRLREILEGDK